MYKVQIRKVFIKIVTLRDCIFYFNRVPMSEFSAHKALRLQKLQLVFEAIMYKQNALASIKANQEAIDAITAHDVIELVDTMVKATIPIKLLKEGINKFLNVALHPLMKLPYTPPQKGTFLDCCVQNNLLLSERLKALRPQLVQINKTPENATLKTQLIAQFNDIADFEKYYIIKENILFPAIEKCWPDFRCLQVMWSFHDDIRRNLKEIVVLLSAPIFDKKQFNKVLGDIYFNMFAIINREERILFPHIETTFTAEQLDALFNESIEMGFPYYNPVKTTPTIPTEKTMQHGEIDLSTGNLTAEQIILLFSHLPVDITYVDENNTVKFYSNPPHRIFPRTNAIIGRDVRNCHPPESVHVVEEIVENFRQGKKEVASFWIKMKAQFILIQYFAVRDKAGIYRGVIEVSQEISEIKALEGERRLLDWTE